MELFKQSTAKLGTRTEICSNRCVTVDGCDGIVDYNDELIILRCGRMKINIAGKDLRLTVFTDTSAVVEGIIKECRFNY